MLKSIPPVPAMVISILIALAGVVAIIVFYA